MRILNAHLAPACGGPIKEFEKARDEILASFNNPVRICQWLSARR